jgi:pyruvate/2-oxoglutarate dehydrogenase complex dihydrolipoamide dehydrogenase (E3) component
MKARHFDIIVIGAGSAGLSVSLGMLEFGFKVLLVDKSDRRIGGECLNDGCVPSKALLKVAKTIHEARNSKEFGMDVSGEPDFEKVKAYINKVQDTIKAHENADYFSRQGMEVVLGKASFTGENSIQVNGATYRARKIVIATGSRPKTLPVKGAEKVEIHTNETIFDLDTLPRKMLIIGGGPIGIEMAQAFRRLGSEVTVLESGNRILSKEDPSISGILLERLKAEGINFHFNSEVEEFSDANSLSFKDGQGNKSTLNFDLLLMAVGREVNFDELETEKAGIQRDEDGHIILDEYLCSSNPHVYVAGDAADQLNFSHAAEHQATTLIKNFLNPIKSKISYDNFSWVTFTDPEVATFGLNAAALEKKGLKADRLEYDFDEDDRAVIGDYRYGKLILWVSKSWIPGGNRKIYGGTMIAPNAGEIIQELVLANSAGLGTKALFNKLHAYPVASRVNKTIILERTRQEVGVLLKSLLRKLY